jgi:hypothetical protein
MPTPNREPTVQDILAMQAAENRRLHATIELFVKSVHHLATERRKVVAPGKVLKQIADLTGRVIDAMPEVE